MISVIVPVYNVERYVGKCIKSIISQSFRNIEIILVNDNSTDNSLCICKKYANIDKRIIIINKIKNEGLENARYSGYLAAKGKYVIHIDSDDWLNNTFVLEQMYQKAEDTNADYVEIGIQRVMGHHLHFKKASSSEVIGLVEIPDLFTKYYLSFFGVNILAVNIWGKLYRKSVLDKANLKPIGIVMGEDLAFNIRLFPFLTRIYILDSIGYNYRFGGMTSRYNPRLLPDLKRLYYLKENLIEQYHYNIASNFIRIELKNVLRSAICQMIYFKIGNRNDILKVITQELNDPIYKRIVQVTEHPHFLKDPFVMGITKKEANVLYNICLECVKKERIKRILKKLVSLILSHI